MKIGLMYISDYGFAVSNNYWSETISNYDDVTLKSNNWMYSGIYEWTILRNAARSNLVFDLGPSGDIYFSNRGQTGGLLIHP